MGLFDEVLSMAGVASGSPQHGNALSAIMDFLNSPQVGGIAGLQRMFEEKGLGGIVSSWIGNGANQAVSTDQLQQVLHSGALQAAAQKSGLDAGQLTGMMSQLLPHLVDKLTPHGEIPESGMLGQLTKGLSAAAS
jgi:uncharacterized protein YidB (DUF937 family)